MNLRLALSVPLLVLALGGATALAAWGWQQADGESGTYSVEAVGPAGPLFIESVAVDEATALRALQAAADLHGVTLDLVEYPGMGTYVRAIGGHEARGASGWVYEVLRAGEWLSGDRSAEFYALQKGDALRWSWTAG